MKMLYVYVKFNCCCINYIISGCKLIFVLFMLKKNIINVFMSLLFNLILLYLFWDFFVVIS